MADLYEVVIGLSREVVADRFFVRANTFMSAATKAHKIFKERKSQYGEKDIVSIAEVGELVE